MWTGIDQGDGSIYGGCSNTNGVRSSTEVNSDRKPSLFGEIVVKKQTKRKGKEARILVVLPTLGKRLDYLRQTLESIRAQAPVATDVVMVFPLSNKETAKLANEYGAIAVDDPGGISAAVNAGIAQAKPHHRYISWIGDDDLLAPESLQAAMAALDQHPDAVVAFGYCDYIDAEGRKIFTSRAGNLAPWLATWGPDLIPCPGALFRLSALRKVGKFDETRKYAMDLDMFLRLRKMGKFINTKRTLASFRWHPTSTTVANRKHSLDEAEQVKRKHLPKAMRPLSFLWEKPVRIATFIAAKRVNTIALRKSSSK